MPPGFTMPIQNSTRQTVHGFPKGLEQSDLSVLHTCRMWVFRFLKIA